MPTESRMGHSCTHERKIFIVIDKAAKPWEKAKNKIQQTTAAEGEWRGTGAQPSQPPVSLPFNSRSKKHILIQLSQTMKY